MEDDENIVIKDIQFGFRRFRAPAKQIYINQHVFLLDVRPNPFTRWLSSWAPGLVSSWLQRLLPEWFLPTTVVLKERNPQRADSYENEIATYQHLRPLQGHCIPRMLGEVASYNHEQTRYQMSKRPVPGILLENVQGVSLQDLPAKELEDPRLIEELKDMYSLFTKNGVVHGDPRLHNFIRTGERIVAIDLEFCHPLPSDITNEDGLETLKDELANLKEERRGNITSV
ncbi:hypothetical protein VTK26DRAFT_6541 [Humicola hyalothermophila]